MIHSSFTPESSIKFSVLLEDQIYEIHRAAVEIFGRTGVKVKSKNAINLLKKAGASVKDEIVRVPEYIIDDCIRLTPKGFILYDREGNKALEVEKRKSYFGSSCASPNIRDPLTGEVHPTRIDDLRMNALITDALPNLDFAMPMGAAWDVPAFASDLYEFEAAVTNTQKPIIFFTLSTRNYELVYEMAAAVAGGIDSLRERPFVIGYPEPITPLVYQEETCEMLLYGAGLGVPQVCIPAGQAGSTSPVTLAGTLALLVAEGLMGLILCQLKRPGTPYILGGFTSIMDMSTANAAFGAPEFHLMNAAFGDITRFYGLPSWGTAGITDAKELDQQASIENTFSLIAQTLAGINIIHDLGYMDQGMISSAEMMVMSDEIVGMVKRFIKGIRIDSDSLAREIIHKVGPGGNFLLESHTLKHCRTEHWIPSLMTRETYEDWKNKGAKTMGHKIREKIRGILNTHKVPSLPGKVLSELEYIRNERTKELTGK